MFESSLALEHHLKSLIQRKLPLHSHLTASQPHF